MYLKLSKKFKRVEDVRSFIFQPEKDLSWLPGQFMHYFLPLKKADKKGDNRYFTISSAPFEKFIQITTRFDHLPISSFKEALWELPIGGKIEAVGPEGEFVIRPEMKKIVWLAGGIGITPFRSMIAQMQHDKSLEGKEISLLYANRDDKIIFKDELDKIASANANSFKLKYIVDPNKIDEKTLEQHLSDDSIFFASGPKPFVDAMKVALRRLGVVRNHIVSDFFPGYDQY